MTTTPLPVVPPDPKAELDATIARAQKLVEQITEAQATLHQLNLRIAYLQGFLAANPPVEEAVPLDGSPA